MLKASEMRRTLRQTCRSEANTPVLGLSLTFGDGEIGLSVELLDAGYAAGHREEIQAALSAFVAGMNVQLGQAGLPEITDQ